MHENTIPFFLLRHSTQYIEVPELERDNPKKRRS
jgi:hypothetical protein